ncbi:MAG: hypothetical protein IPG00_12945 [Saprospiraceae bacterium]|nr:hypothetical protein [Saprospiraceae bacterium]
MTYGNRHCTHDLVFALSQKKKMRDMACYFFQVENYVNFNFINCDDCWFSVPTINLQKICSGSGFKVQLSFLGKPNESYEISVKNLTNSKSELINITADIINGYSNWIFNPIFNDSESVLVNIKKGTCKKSLKIENWACNISLPCYENSIGEIEISSINDGICP